MCVPLESDPLVCRCFRFLSALASWAVRPQNSIKSEIRDSFLGKDLILMRKLQMTLFLLIVLTFAGCATTPPVQVPLSSITEYPDQYRNENVEVTAHVLNNPPPTGDLYRTWNFLIGEPGERILVSEAGYNPSTINRAYHLAKLAQTDNKPITVTGKLRVGPHRALKTGIEIDLDTLSYMGTTVDLEAGPFSSVYRYPYPYPYPSYPYPYPYYPRAYFWGYYPPAFGPYGYGYPYFGGFRFDEGHGEHEEREEGEGEHGGERGERH